MSLIYIKNSYGIDCKRIKVYKIKTMIDGKIIESRKLLRKYWIDELPQLYNLLKGDIKIVGIRPMKFETWDLYSEIMQDALKIKPGLIGIDYAFPAKDKKDVMINYIAAYKKSPFITDLKMFCKVLFCIIFKNVRSK